MSETKEDFKTTANLLDIKPTWQRRVIYEVRPNLCTGCRICELICSLHLTEQFNPSKSAVKLVKRQSEGICFPIVSPFGGVLVDNTGEPILCDLCDGTPKCAQLCPTGALVLLPHQPE